MSETITTITLPCLGSVPAVAAREIKPGDTVIWTHAYQGRILNVERVAAKTLRITEQRDCYGALVGEVTTRTVRAERLVCVRKHAQRFVDTVESETAVGLIMAVAE
jgi:hypothetical protein